VALGVELPDQEESRAEIEEAPEYQADEVGLGRVHHQLAIADVVAERRACRERSLQGFVHEIVQTTNGVTSFRFNAAGHARLQSTSCGRD
jgi:hypothetical protein